MKSKAHKLAVSNGEVEVSELPELYSKQEETDTCVILDRILYLNHAVQAGFKSAVVRTPDTDIFNSPLLYTPHQVPSKARAR